MKVRFQQKAHLQNQEIGNTPTVASFKDGDKTFRPMFDTSYSMSINATVIQITHFLKSKYLNMYSVLKGNVRERFCTQT